MQSSLVSCSNKVKFTSQLHRLKTAVLYNMILTTEGKKIRCSIKFLDVHHIHANWNGIIIVAIHSMEDEMGRIQEDSTFIVVQIMYK